MKVNEVPQDNENLLEGKTRDLQYAVDENGHYTTVKSVGWAPKNDVMKHAWSFEEEKIETARQQAINGEKSPVYYHMIRCLMDIKLLASYTGYSRFKTRRHFKPAHYQKLSAAEREKYRYAFGMKHIDELDNLDKPATYNE